MVLAIEQLMAFTIVIYRTTTMFVRGPFTVRMFNANRGIHVSDDQKHVMLLLQKTWTVASAETH